MAILYNTNIQVIFKIFYILFLYCISFKITISKSIGNLYINILYMYMTTVLTDRVNDF